MLPDKTWEFSGQKHEMEGLQKMQIKVTYSTRTPQHVCRPWLPLLLSILGCS